MKTFNKTNLIILLVLNLVIEFVLIRRLVSWWLVLLIATFVNVGLTFLLLRKLKLLVLPWLFPLVALAFFFLTQQTSIQIYFIITLAIFYALFLLASSDNIIEDNLNNFEKKLTIASGFYFIFVVFFEFLLAACLFGLTYLLQITNWQAGLVFFIVNWLIAGALGRIFFSYYRFKLWTLVCALSLTEIFLSISFWPTNYLVNGFVVAAIFYLFLQFTWQYARDNLNYKEELKRLFFVLSLVIITLLLSEWRIIL